MKRIFRLYCDTSLWNRLGDAENVAMRRASYQFLNRSCKGHEILVSPLVLEEVEQTPNPAERRIILRQLMSWRPTPVVVEARARRMAAELVEQGGFAERMLADLDARGLCYSGSSGPARHVG